MMNRLLFFLFCFSFQYAQAQIDHESVFPDLLGDDLREALIDNYKTNSVLTYSEARDTFMRNIDAVDNVLECVYTGFKVTLDPNLDPTVDAFSQGINTEHTYPRSKGALEGTNAYSDMHHLFPTRERANSDRGSLILAEVPDSQTDKWYFDDNIITTIPSQNIDLYSELLTNESFEPREQHKGDVARAYFYFYTMYQAQADNEAPNFFELQRETMCNWHFQDPVDEKEWNRNNKIATYQEDKKNPFILDCRLARLYCSDIGVECTSVNTKEINIYNLLATPNPTLDKLYFEDEDQILLTFSIINSSGKLVGSGNTMDIHRGVAINVGQLNSGFYFIQLKDADGFVKATSKFVKI
jgi:hypothetical protein